VDSQIVGWYHREGEGVFMTIRNMQIHKLSDFTNHGIYFTRDEGIVISIEPAVEEEIKVGDLLCYVCAQHETRSDYNSFVLLKVTGLSDNDMDELGDIFKDEIIPELTEPIDSIIPYRFLGATGDVLHLKAAISGREVYLDLSDPDNSPTILLDDKFKFN
jgi:hypothetical protein